MLACGLLESRPSSHTVCLCLSDDHVLRPSPKSRDYRFRALGTADKAATVELLLNTILLFDCNRGLCSSYPLPCGFELPPLHCRQGDCPTLGSTLWLLWPVGCHMSEPAWMSPARISQPWCLKNWHFSRAWVWPLADCRHLNMHKCYCCMLLSLCGCLLLAYGGHEYLI